MLVATTSSSIGGSVVSFHIGGVVKRYVVEALRSPLSFSA